MKTRTTFEPSDFEGCGQMIIRNSSSPGSPDLNFAVTVAYKVGYTGGGGNVVMISLADGMVGAPMTIEQLCKELNADVHGYRPMTRREIVKILGNQGARFQ